ALVDHLLTPAFSTSIGLLMWGARAVTEGDGGRYESAPAGGVLGRLREWLRSLVPLSPGRAQRAVPRPPIAPESGTRIRRPAVYTPRKSEPSEVQGACDGARMH